MIDLLENENNYKILKTLNKNNHKLYKMKYVYYE